MCLETVVTKPLKSKKPQVPPYYGTPQTEPGVTENDKEIIIEIKTNS